MAHTELAVAAATWGVLMGVAPLLQIRRMLRQRSSREVSVGYFGILLVGFVLWIAYGIAAGDAALVVPNSVALLVVLSLVAVALRLRREAAAAGLIEQPADGAATEPIAHERGARL
jgi:MtN3 and saliva related transmembrane protein